MKAPDLFANLGRRVALLRRHRGLSQEQLAERASITVSYLSRIEIGRRRPTLEVLAALAAALDVPVWRFLADHRLTTDELGWKEKAQKLARAVAGLAESDIQILLGMAQRMKHGPKPTRFAAGTGDDELPDEGSVLLSEAEADQIMDMSREPGQKRASRRGKGRKGVRRKAKVIEPL